MDGEKVWDFSFEDAVLGLTISEIPQEKGQPEVWAFTKQGWLLNLSLEGELLFKEQITENSSLWCLETYYKQETDECFLVMGGLDGLLRVFSLPSPHTLKPLWAQQFGGSLSGILIEDVDSDGKPEIIAYSLDKTMRVLDLSEGTLKWGQVFEQGISDAIIWRSPSDATQKEVFACGNDGTIRMFNAQNGSLLWFQRFSDKVRFINYFYKDQKTVIVCGGDDKVAHFLNKDSQEELKSLQFTDYVWKGKALADRSKMLISSYSFAYFDESKSIEEIEFTSELQCIENTFENSWTILGKNIECLTPFEGNSKPFIGAGTTTGELLLIHPDTGKILFGEKTLSCVNVIDFHQKTQYLFSAHDDGMIYAYHVKD